MALTNVEHAACHQARRRYGPGDILRRILGSNHFTTFPHQWTIKHIQMRLSKYEETSFKRVNRRFVQENRTDEMDPHPRLSLRFRLLGLRLLARARAMHDVVCPQSSHLATFGHLFGPSVGGIVEQSICKAHLVQSLRIHTLSSAFLCRSATNRRLPKFDQKPAIFADK